MQGIVRIKCFPQKGQILSELKITGNQFTGTRETNRFHDLAQCKISSINNILYQQLNIGSVTELRILQSIIHPLDTKLNIQEQTESRAARPTHFFFNSNSVGYDSLLLRHRLSTSWNSEVGSRKVDYQGSRAYITGARTHDPRGWCVPKKLYRIESKRNGNRV